MDRESAAPTALPPAFSAPLPNAAPVNDASASSPDADSYQRRFSVHSSPERVSTSGTSSSSSSTGSESDHVEIDCGSSGEFDDAAFKKPLHISSMELRFRHISYTVSTRSKRGSDDAGAASVSKSRSGGSSGRSSISRASSALSSVSQQLTGKNHHKRTILADINGAARSGEVTAIMGASGSGKTTLLNILAHRIATERRSGTVELDGGAVRGSTMRRMSAYVMQDDLMFPSLTVRETLMFAAELRLAARAASKEQKEQKVEQLLDLLGLTKVADSLIGDENRRGVSGGERKRVAIGVEMVSDPRILFLDEPTSGLDSTSAYRVVRAIKDIAVQTGSIAIMVLHQPSFRVLSLIDRLLMLASGHTIFHGPPPQLPAFLASFGCPVPQFANSTEFALDLIEDLQRSTRGVTDLVAYASSYQQLSHMSQDPVQLSLEKANGAKPVAALPAPQCTSDTDSCRTDDAATVCADGAVAVQIDDCPAVDAAVVAAASAAALTAQKSVSGGNGAENGAVADPRQYANGWMGELMVLAKRSALNLWRTPALYLLRIALVAVTGIMLATLYLNPDNSLTGFQERLAFFSFSICVLFFCCLDAVPIFIEERNIFIRETTRNAYRPSTYLVATTLVYLPLQLAMATVFVLENWWAINLTGGAAGFFFMLLACFLILFSASSIAIAISIVIDHVVLAYAAGIALMAYFALVSGFYIPKYSIPDMWIWLHYLSPMKYAYEALIQSEFTRGGPCYMEAGKMFENTPLKPYVNETTMNKAFSGMRMILTNTPYSNISAATCLQDGQQLMVTVVGQPDLSMWLNLLVLLGFGLLIRFITFLLLLRLRSLKQQ